MPYKDPEAQRAYQNAWMKRRRQEWLDENGPCDCGSSTDLEVHHKDPSQKVDHKVWSWTEEKRLKELAKCVVKCGKCHGKERRKPIVHGTASGYTSRNYRCRCRACTDAHAVYCWEWQQTRKLLEIQAS